MINCCRRSAFSPIRSERLRVTSARNLGINTAVVGFVQCLIMFYNEDRAASYPFSIAILGGWTSQDRRWQSLRRSCIAAEEMMEWMRNNLAVSSYSLRTVPAREGERLRVGCVGTLSLRALDMPPYLRAAVDLLAAYSFYCGSGSHTAQGLGQTRCIGAVSSSIAIDEKAAEPSEIANIWKLQGLQHMVYDPRTLTIEYALWEMY